MPQWVLWAMAILAAVAAGWAWSSWRHRATTRPSRRRPSGARGPTSPRTRPPRRRQSGTAPRPRDRPLTPSPGTPRPGEIWWADVPYADGTGSKVRPCLVLRADRRHAEVLKITSRDKSNRSDHVPIPTRSWDPDADHDSFVSLADPIRVDPAAFRHRAGTCEPALWRRIRSLDLPAP